MKANNTKKKEYIEPQIEYIPFVYADNNASSDVYSGVSDTGDYNAPWE